MDLLAIFGVLSFMFICFFLALKGIFDLSRIFHKIGFFFPLVWLFFTYIMNFKNSFSGSVLIFWYILGGISFFFGIKKFIELIISRFDPDFTTFRKVHKLKKIGRYPGQINLEAVFPRLINDPAYTAIFNHCSNDDEQNEFLYDWDEYLIDLQQTVFLNPNIPPENLFFSFDEWYVKNECWKFTKYHHLYYTKQAQQYYDNTGHEKSSSQNYERNAENHTNSDSSKWFTGIHSANELKKRYHDLLKIYHPDNNAGDITISQEIQNEYNRLLKIHNW